MSHSLDSIPDWVCWIAQDSSGAWWGYSVEPLRNDKGWYENEVGEYALLGTTDPLDWPNSLKRIKH
ncbi:MAG: hypothetical protein OEY06_07245 [Gammaproteobacteria bacterium]|nr:hypothetical protein [Gammaproteobacteria bacterium]